MRDRVGDARLEQHRRALVDDRADVGRGIEGIAAFERLGARQHLLDKTVGDAVDDQDALDRGAALAGVLGRALDREIGRFVEIGVLHHDEGIVAAEFEHRAAIARLLGDVFADPHRTGEGDEIGVGIDDHRVAHRRWVAGDDARAFRAAGRPRRARRRAPARSAASVRWVSERRGCWSRSPGRACGSPC